MIGNFILIYPISLTFHSNLSNFAQTNLILLRISFKFNKIRSISINIGQIRIKQMNGHLNDSTHNDLYEACLLGEASHFSDFCVRFPLSVRRLRF